MDWTPTEAWREFRFRPPAACSVEAGGAEIGYTHTSGNASLVDLRAFAAAVRPKLTVPVHGVKWDEESRGLGTIRRFADAGPVVIP